MLVRELPELLEGSFFGASHPAYQTFRSAESNPDQLRQAVPLHRSHAEAASMLAECHGEGSGLEVPAGTSAPRECSPHRESLVLWWTSSTMLASFPRSLVCAN
jgi:hypothetical protein